MTISATGAPPFSIDPPGKAGLERVTLDSCHNIIRRTILTTIAAMILATPVSGSEGSRGWVRPCAVLVLVSAGLLTGVGLKFQFERRAIENTVSRASIDPEILTTDMRNEKLAGLILVTHSHALHYLADPPSALGQAEDYLKKNKWIPLQYRPGKSVAHHVLDYVQGRDWDPTVQSLITDLKALPYEKMRDEDWYRIAIEYLGNVIPEYNPKQDPDTGLAWEKNANLRALWRKAQTGISDEQRPALVPFLLLEQTRDRGNRDLIQLLISSPGFLEAVKEEPESYSDWIIKAAGHLKNGDQEAAKRVGRGFRHIRTGAVVNVLNALGPACFRTFLLESGHTDYIAEGMVAKDPVTFRPILLEMLRSPDAREGDLATAIWEKVPQLEKEP